MKAIEDGDTDRALRFLGARGYVVTPETDDAPWLALGHGYRLAASSELSLVGLAEIVRARGGRRSLDQGEPNLYELALDRDDGVGPEDL